MSCDEDSREGVKRARHHPPMCQCEIAEKDLKEMVQWLFGSDVDEVDASMEREEDGSIPICKNCNMRVNVPVLANTYAYEIATIKAECYERFFSKEHRFIDGLSSHNLWQGPPQLYEQLHQMCKSGIPTIATLESLFTKYEVKGSDIMQKLRLKSAEVSATVQSAIHESQQLWIDHQMEPPSALSHLTYRQKQDGIKLHVVSSEERGVMGVYSSEEGARSASLSISFPGDGDVYTQTFELDNASMVPTEPPKFDIIYNSSAASSIIAESIHSNESSRESSDVCSSDSECTTD